MRERLHHRGPDSAGAWCEGPVALAHRRLAIIDLNTGHQPMHSADATLHIVFNGEIYNYLELRAELETKGHRFRSNSDTEVILAAYREWSHACVQHFNGVWAFALYDARNAELFCSRDRLGEKPFFYTQADNSFVFGSEIKALVEYGLQLDVNLDMLDTYLCLSYVPAPHTFYRNIFKLEPGCSLIVRSGTLHTQRYWDVPIVPIADQRQDEDAVLAEFEELLYDAVRLRMRSDVPFGAFLSGGLDSASIVRCMSELQKTPVQTFTAGFENRAYDERDLAALVAKACGTEHRSIEVDMHKASSLLPTLAELYDEPFGDSSALPSYLIAAEAKKYLTVVLTGDGGDEVLGGYTIHQGEKFARMYGALPGFLRTRFFPQLSSIASQVAPRAYRAKAQRLEKLIRSSAAPFELRLLDKQNGFYTHERFALMTSKTGVSAEDVLHSLLKPVQGADSFQQLNYWLTKVSLPDDMLTKVDRATMAHGVEARLPFLDHRVVELLCTVSMDIRMKGFERKSLLRRIMANKLPAELFRASKRGFVVPLNDWLADPTERSLHEGIAKAGDTGLVRNAVVREYLSEQANDNYNSQRAMGNALWSLGMMAESVTRLRSRAVADTTPYHSSVAEKSSTSVTTADYPDSAPTTQTTTQTTTTYHNSLQECHS